MVQSAWSFLQQYGSAIGVVVTVLVAVVTWWISIRSGRRKLSYYARTSRALQVDRKLASDLTVTFRGEPVKAIWLTSLHLRNRGTREIVADDILEAIAFGVGPDCRILNCELVSDGDPGTRISPRIRDGALELEVALINAGENHEVSVLTDRLPELKIIKGRIVGIHTIKQDAWENWYDAPWVSFAPLGVAILLFGAFIHFDKQGGKDLSLAPEFTGLVAIMSGSSFAYRAYVERSERRGRDNGKTTMS